MRFSEMKIGEVAKAAGIGIDAVRFYERQGLLPEPARRPSGYRMYSCRFSLFVQRGSDPLCRLMSWPDQAASCHSYRW